MISLDKDGKGLISIIFGGGKNPAEIYIYVYIMETY